MPATVIVPHISGGAQTDIPDTSSDFSEEDIRDLTPEQARKILYELRVHQEELISQNEELRAAQESLEISRARYFNLYHLAPVGYLTLNEKGVILTANLTAGTLLGQELKTMTGQPFAQYILPADNDIYYLHRRRLFETGQPQVCEIRMIKQGGNWFWAHIETTLITVENNTPTCHAVISDITNRKQAEETRSHLEQQLHHVMKAESLGRMAGAIAHHFNNLLAIVIGNLELAKNEIMQGSRLQTFISESLAASHRAAETSSLMLAYIGDTMGNREPTDLLALCSSILPLCITALPHNVELKTEFPLQAPVVDADEIQLRRALINLIMNAGESYLEQKGEIILSIRTLPAVEIPSGLIFPRGWTPLNNEYACITVADSGCGIDPCHLDNLFDPFFSTKFTGRGMGLAVVIGTAKSHRGAIIVESKLEIGSRFHLLLPLLKVKTVQPPPAMEISPPSENAKGGVILLVDDNPTLRNMVETMLKLIGYDVMTAEDGVAAIDVFTQYQAAIRCVLMDLSMPRKGGWETLTALRQIRPGLPVILSSGFDEMQAMAYPNVERPQAFLHKPYQLAELKAVLEKAMK